VRQAAAAIGSFRVSLVAELVLCMVDRHWQGVQPCSPRPVQETANLAGRHMRRAAGHMQLCHLQQQAHLQLCHVTPGLLHQPPRLLQQGCPQ
jgi:hypothetical protein